MKAVAQSLPEGRLAQERRKYMDARSTVAALMRERVVDNAGVLKLAGRVLTGKTWRRDPPFDRRERLLRYQWDFSRLVLLDPWDNTRQERAERCLLGLRDSDFLGFDTPTDDLPTLQYAFLTLCELYGVGFWKRFWTDAEKEGYLSLRETDQLPKGYGLDAAVGGYARGEALEILADLAHEHVKEQIDVADPFGHTSDRTDLDYLRGGSSWSHKKWSPPEIPLIAERKVKNSARLNPYGGWTGAKRASRPFLWDERRLRQRRRLAGDALRTLIVDEVAKFGYSLEEAVATVKPGRKSGEQQQRYDALACAVLIARTQDAEHKAIGWAIGKDEQASQRLAKRGASLADRN